MTANRYELEPSGQPSCRALSSAVELAMSMPKQRRVGPTVSSVRYRIIPDSRWPIVVAWVIWLLFSPVLKSSVAAQDRTARQLTWDASQPAPDEMGYSPLFFHPEPDGWEAADGGSESYLDLDAYLRQGAIFSESPSTWDWQILPDGLIYRPYLAGPKESRLASHVVHGRHDNWLWEATLGRQAGLLRWGSHDPDFPLGFQIDVEGSAQARLDLQDEVDVRSVDFRAGVPITFGYGRHRTKIGYYHISSHLGDEFLLKHPDFDRLNFARDALILGHAYYLTPSQRIYGEAGWAFYTDVAKEWEFQFGYEFNPVYWMTRHGSPFFAIHGHLREELNYGGGLAVQTGWAWRARSGRQLRMGMHFYNGKSTQYSFFNDHEQLIGFVIAYDR
jgi:hypothetical protein